MTGEVKQTFTPLDANTVPAPLDVVWCRFPFPEGSALPGKGRPGLIFSAGEHKKGFHVVQVAYGTSKLKTDTRLYDFLVCNYQAMHCCGLFQATRFDLDKVMYIPWSAEWFESPDLNKYSTPVIGRLPVNHVVYLKQLLQERELRKMSVPDCI